MTFPILASLLVRLVVLLPFQLLRLSLATPSRWTPLALSVFLHCVRSEERRVGNERIGYVDGPEGQTLRMVERPVDLGADGKYLVMVAGDASEIVEEPRAVD